MTDAAMEERDEVLAREVVEGVAERLSDGSTAVGYVKSFIRAVRVEVERGRASDPTEEDRRTALKLFREVESALGWGDGATDACSAIARALAEARSSSSTPSCIHCLSWPEAESPCPCSHAPCVHDANREKREAAEKWNSDAVDKV